MRLGNQVRLMAEYLEYACGSSNSRDSYQAGREAADKAVNQITKFKPTLVVVFASVRHELERALAGVQNITGNVPMVGCSSAGEYCGKLMGGTVTVIMLASPHLEIKVGLGKRVSADYTTAVCEMINSAQAAEFFNSYNELCGDADLNEFTKKPFALFFMPGPEQGKPFYGKEIIDLIRKRTMSSLPLAGGCASAESGWENSYLFCNGKVYTDCIVGVFVKTHLKFGIATVHHYLPKEMKLIVTKSNGQELLELNGRPAADYFADCLGIDFGELTRNVDSYLFSYPFGLKDFTGYYYLVPGMAITPEHGIRCLSTIEEGTVLHIMEPSSEMLLQSAEDFLRKAVLRGKIMNPMAGLVFSSVHRVNSLRELIPLAIQKIYKSINKPFCFTGFCSNGEIGLTGEGVASFFNMSLSGLVFGDELNEAAQIAQKNMELCRELSETAQKNQELYKELSIVHELGNLLNSSLKLGFVINKAVQMVARLMKAEGCILFLYDQENDTVKTVSYFGLAELPKDFDLKNTLAYQALKQEKKLLIKNVSVFPHLCPLLREYIGAESAIISPIIVKKQKIGIIAVYSKQENFYDDKDLEFLHTLANQIGIAVVNADLYERTELLACTDGLTGMYDHTYFLTTLERLLVKAEEKGDPLSLIMVDLDDFKYYNDKYGHTVGDLILKTTAQILRENVRSDDIIARYGGDEFAVILVNAGPKKAARIAERISKHIANEPFNDPETVNVFYITASVGIATYPFDASNSKELIDVADKAMYLTKRTTKAKTSSYLAEFEELEAQLTPSEKALLDTIKLLIQMLDSRDRYTWEHCRQVARYVTLMAEKLGLSKETVSKLKLAGYLHDMGKIHVKPEVLNKPGWLAEHEMETVKLHPVVGANLLSPIKGFREIRDIIYYHHEWFNGKGYPEGLKGEQIPLGSRILAIADGFDAMTSNRPYRKARTFEWAVEELKKQSGCQYDPALVQLFLELLEEEGRATQNRP
ncbi:diguanylate cyclase [Thermincola potens]|nr:diguanylate cyclase [Thermincola potens]